MGITDIAKLTEFDCWCCVLKCNHPGEMNCVAVAMVNLSWYMIMDGWNYEVSQDYCKPTEHKYKDVRIPFSEED